jgi:hypothetical protein
VAEDLGYCIVIRRGGSCEYGVCIKQHANHRDANTAMTALKGSIWADNLVLIMFGDYTIILKLWRKYALGG